MLRVDPQQRPRLVEIIRNLGDRITEARHNGWLGEVDGLQVSLNAARAKLAALDRIKAAPTTGITNADDNHDRGSSSRLSFVPRACHNPLGHAPLLLQASDTNFGGWLMNRARWWHLAGAAMGFVGAVTVWRSDALGLGAAVAGSVFAAALLLGVLVGEILRPRPDPGSARSAALEVRRARDYLPQPAMAFTVAAGVTLLVLLGTASALAASDDQGRTGRALTLACINGSTSVTAGPWPGAFYSAPIGAIVLAGLALAALIARRLVLRPRATIDPPDLDRDESDRRQTARIVTAACGVLVTVPLTGSAYFVASALAAADCAGRWPHLLSIASGAVAAGSFIAATGFLSMLIWPAPRDHHTPLATR
jgi:hypothetical protein